MEELYKSQIFSVIIIDEQEPGLAVLQALPVLEPRASFEDHIDMQTTLKPLNDQEQNCIQVYVRKLNKEMGEQVVSVILFGSRARGDAHFDSDLDLAIIIKQDDFDTQTKIRDLAAETWLENGLYISTRVWSQDHWHRMRSLNTGLYQNIQRDGIDLLSALS